MKQIKPTYRAQFEQPLGPLNPMGVKLRGPIDVEIFEMPGRGWKARRPGTNAEFECHQHMDADSIKAAMVSTYFGKQLTPWTLCYGGEPLDPSRFHTGADGKVSLLEPEDFTHVGHPSGAGTDKKKGRAACGELIAFDKFASLFAGSPPTCPACRTAYDKIKGAS